MWIWPKSRSTQPILEYFAADDGSNVRQLRLRPGHQHPYCEELMEQSRRQRVFWQENNALFEKLTATATDKDAAHREFLTRMSGRFAEFNRMCWMDAFRLLKIGYQGLFRR